MNKMSTYSVLQSSMWKPVCSKKSFLIKKSIKKHVTQNKSMSSLKAIMKKNMEYSTDQFLRPLIPSFRNLIWVDKLNNLKQISLIKFILMKSWSYAKMN